MTGECVPHPLPEIRAEAGNRDFTFEEVPQVHPVSASFHGLLRRMGG
jgi:hypothetical protein